MTSDAIFGYSTYCSKTFTFYALINSGCLNIAFIKGGMEIKKAAVVTTKRLKKDTAFMSHIT